MKTLQASLSMLTLPAVWRYIGQGVVWTLVVAILSVLAGIVFGTVLALARNYCKSGPARPLGWLATLYIEIFRNTPLLLWIFICLVFCPAPRFSKAFGLSSVELSILFRACVALMLFTSSVVAEIVRGGLNSIPRGQFEAGYSQGFNTAQILLYIVLPQTFHNIIPTLLSQVITTVKDTSYVANVAVIELMARVKKLLAVANTYTGQSTVNVSDVFVLFGCAFVIYFIINFTLSCIVRRTRHRGKKSALA